MTDVAIVTLSNNSKWVFEKDDINGWIIHTTKYGTLYRIFLDVAGKPIWIGKLHDDNKSFYSVEKEIGAVSVNFIGYGIYLFS